MFIENNIDKKSFEFAVRVVKLYQSFQMDNKEFELSEQFLKSGTNIGAVISVAIHSETKTDFMNYLVIAQKEAHNTIYWLELINTLGFITASQYDDIHGGAVELLNLITDIIKKEKSSLDIALLN